MNDVGTAPAVPPIPSHVPVDAGGFLEQDVQCRRCAYNLRGLKADGLCPECGIAVGLSTQRDLLRFADPGWLATVHRGTRLILWGLLVAILGGCVAHAAVSSTGNSAIGAIVVILSQVVALWGTWLLTEPDPSRVGDDRWSGTRQFVRYSIAASLVGSLLPIMEEFLHPPPMIGIVLTVIGVVLALVGAAGGVAQMLYLGSLAMRIPNPMIAGRCRFLAWTIGIFGIGTVLSSTVAFFVFTAAPPPAVPPPFVGTVQMVVGGFTILYSLFSLIALFTINRFRKELASIMAFSRDTYSSSSTTAGPIAG